MLPSVRTGFQHDLTLSSGQLDVPKPTTLKDDDYLLLYVTNKGGGLPSVSGGGTWTALGDATSGNNSGQGTTRGAVFGRVVEDAASEPSTYTVTGLSDSATATVIAVANVDQRDPINAFAIEGNSSPDHNNAGVTTDSDDCLIVALVMLADNVVTSTAGGAWSATNPASLTQPAGANQTNGAGTDSAVSFASAARTTAGATGTVAWTPFSTDADNVMAVVALNPDTTPTWRSNSAVVTATTGNLTPAKPSGLADDDVLLVVAASKTGAPSAVSGGTGSFTQLATASVSGLDLVLFGKAITNAAGEPATYTVTCPGTGDVRTAVASAVRDCDVADYIDAITGQGNASGTNQAPAVTTEGHTLVVGIVVNGDDGLFSPSLTYTDPAALSTEVSMNTLSGTDLCGEVRRAAKQVAGTTGTGSYTPVNAAINDAITMSLRGNVPAQASEGSASASGAAQATASGEKDASGSASSSAKPQVTASGFGPTEAHSGSAAVTLGSRAAASGAAARSGSASASLGSRATASGAASTSTFTPRSSMMF